MIQGIKENMRGEKDSLKRLISRIRISKKFRRKKGFKENRKKTKSQLFHNKKTIVTIVKSKLIYQL